MTVMMSSSSTDRANRLYQLWKSGGWNSLLPEDQQFIRSFGVAASAGPSGPATQLIPRPVTQPVAQPTAMSAGPSGPATQFAQPTAMQNLQNAVVMQPTVQRQYAESTRPPIQAPVASQQYADQGQFQQRQLQQRAYAPSYGGGIYNMYNAFNGRR